MTSTAPFAIRDDEAPSLPTLIPGGPVSILAHTTNTNGSLTVLEFGHPAKTGPPRHVHVREDEVWYVLEGEYRFKIGESMFTLSEGGLAFGPRGMPHAFQNVGDRPGRLLVITTPAGLERFFSQHAELLPGPVDRDELDAVSRANWLEFTGPPLAVSDPL
jgi:mannose-6-phosphate isomerase-like protein (cupin superfamily)